MRREKETPLRGSREKGTKYGGFILSLSLLPLPGF
jgi:hypothetical protein